MQEKKEMVGAVKHMKKSGVLRIVIIGAIIGLLFLVLGSSGIFSQKEQEDDGETVSGYGSYLEYKVVIESEVEELCKNVCGVSQVSAVVFFDDVGGSKYAQNSQKGSYGEKNEYVIIGSGSNSHALYIGESLPEISGIGIVCRTGGSDSKRAELTALIATTYGLSMTRVYVCEAE